MSDADAIAARLETLRARIAAAAARAGRQPAEIALVGVSKRKTADEIVAAVRAGLDRVGENYVQEALEKLPRVRAELERSGTKAPRWHFIGRLQRNKARAVAEAFDCVETVDRESLGRELERRVAAAGRRLEVLVQVNVSGESQKGGVDPDALPELLAASRDWPHLDVTGLMAIPAMAGEAEASRPAFARLRELAAGLRAAPGGAGLRELSMGMSHDFEVAIEEGATRVRVGTALFGPRER